jgi:hypothetical protein
MNSSGQTITRLTPDDIDGGPVRTKNVHRFERLGRQINGFFPEGWVLESKEDKLLLGIEKLHGTVVLSVTSGGRPQVAGVLSSANGSSFDRFKLVSMREDAIPAVRKSGSYVASTLRIGPSVTEGTAVAWHIVGTGGSIVWRIDYSATSEAAFKDDKKLIERLIEYTAVEISQ